LATAPVTIRWKHGLGRYSFDVGLLGGETYATIKGCALELMCIRLRDGMSVTEAKDAETRTPAPGQGQPRRAWHAPKFHLLDVAATDAMCNAASDAVPGSLS
jgi:hypothetical protein